MMNRIELKQEAKGVVRTAAVSAYLFALLYLALTELLQGASVYVNGDVVLYMQTYFPNVPIPSYLYPVALPTTVVTLVAVVCWLLRVLLQGGWVLYHLGVRRGEEMPYATLFDGFGFIGKLILLNIVITLYVFLWSMLFIIPGIIAGYRYRFAVYNLCENPDMGVMEAISMSKAQTAGYKGALFLLALLVQTVVFGNRTILGAHPDLVAIVITCVCLREGPERGGTFALIASLVWCLSGIDQGSVCLLVLTVLPVLGSILCRAVLANRFLPSLLVCFVTLAVEQGLILLMKHFFAGVAWEQAGRALRCLLVTLPVQPAVYGLVKCIAKIGEYHEST